jgi:hypothetical protein
MSLPNCGSRRISGRCETVRMLARVRANGIVPLEPAQRLNLPLSTISLRYRFRLSRKLIRGTWAQPIDPRFLEGASFCRGH